MELDGAAAAVSDGDGFGNHVRRARERLRYTQEQLGRIAGINKETVMRIEQGVGDFRIGTIQKLRNVLPGLPHGIAKGAHNQLMGIDDNDDAATKIVHLVYGIASFDRLQRIREFIVQQLHEEQQQPKAPPTLRTVKPFRKTRRKPRKPSA